MRGTDLWVDVEVKGCWSSLHYAEPDVGDIRDVAGEVLSGGEVFVLLGEQAFNADHLTGMLLCPLEECGDT